jgi:tRNA-binding EMAP/Myf-like protein
MTNTNPSLIVTARIEKVVPHPQANNLKVVTLTDGSDNFQVVCGSQNIFTGMITVLAKEGAVLPTSLAIQKANLRGVESHGMICSPRELGVRSESGAVDLAPDTQLNVNWLTLHPMLISSTPWYRFELVEQFFVDEKKNIISKHHYRKNLELSDKSVQLIGQTYFDPTKQVYHYQKLEG